MALAGAALALALASATIGGVVATHAPAATVTATPSTAVSASGTLSSLADVVAAVAPSVVSINVTERGGSGEGSGIILTANGAVLTNAHVVQDATSITVTLSSGRTVPATVLGADTTRDIAVLQMSGVSGLKPAALGRGVPVRTGDTVLAFGSPLGLDGSVTSGIVSALNRQVEGRTSTLSGVIQTDAAINPGNSGGPLVDTAGRVIGINTAIATTGSTSGNIGVGFAIPIDAAMAVADRYLR
jgi:putative serine protease PepD